MSVSDFAYLKGIGQMSAAKQPTRVSALGDLKPAMKTADPKVNRRKAGLSGGGMKSSKSTGSLRRNKISFGDTSTLVFEKDIDNDDEEHMNEVWFSKKEMKTIRKDLKKSIKNGDITRGLEPYEGDMGAETKQKRLEHMYSILDLQREQQARGICDDAGLQRLSRAMSADDIKKAMKLASMDSTNALSEYTSDAAIVKRTDSRSALDNFRKSVGSNSRLNKLTLGFGGRSTGGKNATFGNASSQTRRAKKAPNMLLAAMASKPKNEKSSPSGAQAGVA